MSLKNNLILTFFIFSFTQTALSQQIEGKINFHGFADNREYAPSHRYSQTIFGSRITPELGFFMDSIHRISIGISYLHEFGTKHINNPIRPVAYYNYTDYDFDFKIGMFPRYKYLDIYPKAMLNDTIVYYQPNIEGMLLKYENEQFYEQLWIDWNSRQTSKDREQFMVGLSGDLIITSFLYLRHFAILWHNAGRMFGKSDPDDNIRDNGAASIHLGAKFRNTGIFDCVDINAGGVINYDRLRGVYDWSLPKGFIIHAYWESYNFFLRNTLYLGEPLAIPYGDPFYTSTQYHRLDIGWIPLRGKNIEGRFTAGFHFSEGAIDNQQQFILRYKISRKWVKNSREKMF